MLDVRLLVVTAISLALGVYVFYEVMGNISSTDSEANQTITQVKSNFGTAFKLAAIIGIVLGAVWIMRALNLF